MRKVLDYLKRVFILLLTFVFILSMVGCGKKKSSENDNNPWGMRRRARPVVTSSNSKSTAKKTTSSRRRSSRSSRRRSSKRGKSKNAKGNTNKKNVDSIMIRLLNVSDKKLLRLNVNPLFFEYITKRLEYPLVGRRRNVFRDVKKNLKLRAETEKKIEQVAILLDEISQLEDNKYQKSTFKKATDKFNKGKDAYNKNNYLKALALLKEAENLARQSVALEYRSKFGGGEEAGAEEAIEGEGGAIGVGVESIRAQRSFIYYGYYEGKGGKKAFLWVKDSLDPKSGSMKIVGEKEKFYINTINPEIGTIKLKYQVLEIGSAELVLKTPSGIAKIPLAKITYEGGSGSKTTYEREVNIIGGSSDNGKGKNKKKGKSGTENKKEKKTSSKK